MSTNWPVDGTIGTTGISDGTTRRRDGRTVTGRTSGTAVDCHAVRPARLEGAAG